MLRKLVSELEDLPGSYKISCLGTIWFPRQLMCVGVADRCVNGNPSNMLTYIWQHHPHEKKPDSLLFPEPWLRPPQKMTSFFFLSVFHLVISVIGVNMLLAAISSPVLGSLILFCFTRSDGGQLNWINVVAVSGKRWREDRDRSEDDVFLLLMLLVYILRSTVEVDSRPRGVGGEGGESQRESSTSSWETVNHRQTLKSGVGKPHHRNHQRLRFLFFYFSHCIFKCAPGLLWYGSSPFMLPLRRTILCKAPKLMTQFQADAEAI